MFYGVIGGVSLCVRVCRSVCFVLDMLLWELGGQRFTDRAHVNGKLIRSPLDVVWLTRSQYKQNLVLGEIVLMANDERWKRRLTVLSDARPPSGKLRGLN